MTTWDKYAIKAEINRRGQNLSGLERIYGLKLSACRKALSSQGNLAGEKAIADFLAIPYQYLFPNRDPKRKRGRPPLNKTKNPTAKVKNNTNVRIKTSAHSGCMSR